MSPNRNYSAPTVIAIGEADLLGSGWETAFGRVVGDDD